MIATPSNLRALAAALETPDDLTEEELKQAHTDIAEYLLCQASINEIIIKFMQPMDECCRKKKAEFNKRWEERCGDERGTR